MSSPVFFTTTIHLTAYPPEKLLGDPIGLHGQSEAIEKMHRFCHEIYHVPVSWIVSWGALQQYGARLKEFCRDYGDDVGILEYGVEAGSGAGSDDALYQGWVTEAGLLQPETFDPSEPESFVSKTWNDMTPAEQRQGIGYLKSAFEAVLERPVTTFASPYVNGETVKILTELGFTCLWSYNWNYDCEGINNRGCLPHPFYPHAANHNVPAAVSDGPLAVHWGPFSATTYLNADVMSHRVPTWCLNSMELTNRSPALDEQDYHRKVLAEYFAQTDRNPFVHIPLQLEATWLDEGPELEGYYDQYPDYNARCTEAFYSQIEYCLRHGATGVSLASLAAWHREQVGTTSEVMLYSEDPVPTLRANGKDRAYEPAVVWGNADGQYYFSRSAGFNYVTRYDYVAARQTGELTPLAAPAVTLLPKRSFAVSAGIRLSDAGARYVLDRFTLHAETPQSGYAALWWEANLPSYVTESNIVTEHLTGFRLLRDKNAVLLLADLPAGDTEIGFSSDAPGRYIRIQSVELIGKRCEIWIENTGEEVALTALDTTLPAGLRLGGFWWDGTYYRTLSQYDWMWYDRASGQLHLGAGYPKTFPVRQGLTRCSIELR